MPPLNYDKSVIIRDDIRLEMKDLLNDLQPDVRECNALQDQILNDMNSAAKVASRHSRAVVFLDPSHEEALGR